MLKKILLASVAALALVAGALYALAPGVLVDAEFARQALLAGMHEHTITAAGHRVSYYEGGSGEPLVLVHGFTGSKENWLESARYLTPHFRVIAPDLPGWGESERRAGEDYTPSDQARRLAEILDALAIPRATIVGHSMGGHIAGLFAVRYPGRVENLVLVDSAGVHFTPNDFARRVIAGATPFNFSDRAEFDAFMAELFVSPRWLPGRLKDALIARNVAGHAFHAALLRELTTEPTAFLLEHQLAHVEAPTFVLWCRGDKLLDVSSVDVLVMGLRSAKRLDSGILEGCSHMPMMEMPREFAARILAFLGKA
jgi:pimeloyl-ACP methyl ester carboxylesterase